VSATKKLSEAMRETLWAMLSHKRNPEGFLIIDERTAQALVRRGLLSSGSGGYILDEKAARRALALSEVA
jgi:hypothetical protein